MSEYNTKNYTEPGGEKTVIGGTLAFTDDAKVENFPGGGGYTLPTATDEILGGVKIGDGVYMVGDKLNLFTARVGMLGGVQAATNQADSEATTIAALKEDFNTLLASLRTAGILKDA